MEGVAPPEGDPLGRGKKLFPVFVYGTLLEGEHYHRELKASQKVGKGTTPGRLFWVRVNYFPGAIFEEGDKRIYGEVYLVTKEVRDRLDDLEGYYVDSPERSMYTRRPVTVSMEDGSSMDAESYEYRGKFWPALLIPGGDFRKAGI
jgi:gamma-glutamylcyclotransferase (GGCT)/AIG2-like uncharacterized protein YtfP